MLAAPHSSFGIIIVSNGDAEGLLAHACASSNEGRPELGFETAIQFRG